MGFISFVKKFFGTKENVTEENPQLEEVKSIVINPTSEFALPLEGSLTIEASNASLTIEASNAIGSQITDSVTVTKENRKKEVTKKRNYKPRKKVTKKPANKKRVTK